MEKNVNSRGLLSLIAVTFLFVMGYQVFDPILTLYMREVGATEFEVGMMLAASILVGIMSRIPFGIASEKLGKRNTILIALVTLFVSTVFLYFVSEPFWFYPALALQALPMSLFWASAVALASDMTAPEKRGEAVGRYFTAFGLAMFLGPLLCSFLTVFLSYRNVLLVLLPFPVVSTAIFLKKLAKRNRESQERTEEVETNVLNSFKRICKSRNVRALYLTNILNSIPLSIFATLFSIYCREKLFFTASLISLLFGARGGANALIRTPVGKISDKIGNRKNPLILSGLLHILAFLTISLTSDYLLLILAMIIFGLGWGTRVAVGNTLLIENLESEDRGLALSISITLFGVGRFLGSSFAGFTSPFLPANDAFKLSIPLFLSVILVLVLVIKERRH
jgi:DHA1 family multidrug resistance protein-like MFS transporter